MNTDNDYIGLFNEDATFSVDDDTIKINNDNNIYVNQISNDKIKFLLPYRLLASNNLNQPIETKLTDDYINNFSIHTNKLIFDNANTILISNSNKEATETKNINDCLNDNSINQSKILNLISDLSTINNNFTNYYNKSYIDNNIYTKTQSDNNYYNKSYIDNLIALYYTKVQIDNILTNYYTKSLTYSKTEADNKFALITSLNTTNSNVSTLQSYFSSNQLKLENLYPGVYGSGDIYTVLCSVPNTGFQSLQWQQISDNFVGAISISKIINLQTTLNNKADLTTSSLTNYSTTTTNDSRYLRTGQNLNISTFNFTTSGIINATTGSLRANNLSAHNSANIVIGSGLDLQNTYKIINSADTDDTRPRDLVTVNYLGGTFLNNIITLLNQRVSYTVYDNDNAAFTYSYSYNNWRDSTTGLMRLNSLVPPGSNGTYYLQCVRSALINNFSWVTTSSLSFDPYNTFSKANQNQFMKLEQIFNPAQSSTVSNELIISNSFASDYLISIGYNSSGWFGATNLGARYGYIYNGSANLRIFNFNGSTVDTALLIGSSNIEFNRNLVINGNRSINNGSGSLTTGSISSGSINTNNNNINFGTASCFGNNYVNSSGGASYHPQGWTCNNTSSMGNFRITNVATPTSSTDCVNKTYCDNNSIITIPTNRITTSTNGISDGVRLVRGPGGTGDVSIFADNGTSTLLWNGWGRCGLRSTHRTQTFQNRFTISNDRFAFIMGNDTTSGQNPGSYLSEWYYYNTLRAYITNGGVFTNSDKNMKHSFRNKSDICNLNKKNYLNRILKLPIYSYAFNNCDDDHCNSELYIGPLYQDVKEIFNNNCVGNRKYLENYKCKEDCGTCKRRKEYYGEEVKTISASEISYYHILAFQEYVNKTDETINNLQNKYNDLENKFNQLLNKLNLSL